MIAKTKRGRTLIITNRHEPENEAFRVRNEAVFFFFVFSAVGGWRFEDIDKLHQKQKQKQRYQQTKVYMCVCVPAREMELTKGLQKRNAGKARGKALCHPVFF